MDLQAGVLYWPQTVNKPPVYPPLEEDIVCDVLVIGGGSSGAQIANLLQGRGLKVVVTDKRKVGSGSTSSNTGLIQYLGDKTITELVGRFGEEKTFRHFKLCQQAINDIESESKHLPIDSHFFRRNSLYFASDEKDLEGLKSDFEYLRKHGFQVSWLSEEEIADRYSIKKSAAIYIFNDGEMNPLKYVYGLLEAALQAGVKIFEETEVTAIRNEKEGVEVHTKLGYSIQAKKVVIAGGYETIEFRQEKNTQMASTYAVVTTPVGNFQNWYERSLIWETARPYIYMRTTEDNRIIIGGLDESITDTKERDQKMILKRDQLMEEFNKLFPSIKVDPEYYLGAYFGGTHDGLPMIGMYDSLPNCYYIFGFGENGTVYNMVLGKIVADHIINGKSDDLDLYIQTRSRNV